MDGRIPLHFAVDMGNVLLCDTLLKYGHKSDWLVKDNNGLCPYHNYRYMNNYNSNRLPSRQKMKLDYIMKEYPAEVAYGYIHILLLRGLSLSKLQKLLNANADAVNTRNDKGVPALFAAQSHELFL
jgi:ankyrin repeat protein